FCRHGSWAMPIGRSSRGGIVAATPHAGRLPPRSAVASRAAAGSWAAALIVSNDPAATSPSSCGMSQRPPPYRRRGTRQYTPTERMSMAAETSTYLLIFRETTPERYEALSREERMQALARWNAWCDELVAQGKLRSGNTLQPEGRV